MGDSENDAALNASKGEPASAPTPAPQETGKAKEEAPPADKPVAGMLRRLRPSSSGPRATPPEPPRKTKRRREGALSALSGLMSFALVAVIAAFFTLMSAHHLLNEPGPLRADKTVILPAGADTPEILAQLESEGIIDNAFLMNITLMMEGHRSALRSGEYLFKQNVTPREVIDELVNGRQVMHAITIPEGLTSEQIAQRLRDSDVLAGDIHDTPKEGALLPETYKVARGYPRSKLINKMQEDQRKLVDQIWARRSKSLPFRTPYELVTLASIVEKETGRADERPHVAAVFVNRLRKGMRLQSDPTIVYGLVGGKATLGRGLLRSELEKYTPYNTYMIDGLPPGPIANPGRASLEAAANPMASGDLYFVADGTGGHVFASSLDQHNRNVQRWRQIERDKSAPDLDHASPGAAPAPPVAPLRGGQRGDAGEIIRFLSPFARCEDYPKSSQMGADDGATHRLGKFGPRAGLLAVESLDDPTFSADRRFDPLRVARAYFTNDGAQPRETVGSPLSLERIASIEESESAAADTYAAGANDDAGDVASYPVSEARRAELKARAARLGLQSTNGNKLPDGVIGARDDQADDKAFTKDARAAAYAPTQDPLQHRRARIVDASEGSAIDPLRDRSWDLSTAKTVPSNLNLR